MDDMTYSNSNTLPTKKKTRGRIHNLNLKLKQPRTNLSHIASNYNLKLIQVAASTHTNLITHIIFIMQRAQTTWHPSTTPLIQTKAISASPEPTFT